MYEIITVEGEGYAAVRLPELVNIPQAVYILVSNVIISAAHKPRGRIGDV